MHTTKDGQYDGVCSGGDFLERRLAANNHIIFLDRKPTPSFFPTMTNHSSCGNRQQQSARSALNTKEDSLVSLLAQSRKASVGRQQQQQQQRRTPHEIASSLESSLSSLSDFDDISIPREQDYSSRDDWMRAILDASLEDLDSFLA